MPRDHISEYVKGEEIFAWTSSEHRSQDRLDKSACVILLEINKNYTYIGISSLALKYRLKLSDILTFFAYLTIRL